MIDKLLNNIDNKAIITGTEAQDMLGVEQTNDISIIVEDVINGDIVDRCVFEDGHALHIS